MVGRVLVSWDRPYPDCDAALLRPKRYSLVELRDGTVAFGKWDSNPIYVWHEADVLRALDGLSCAPSLVFEMQDTIYLTYIDGPILTTQAQNLRLLDSLRFACQIVSIVRVVHRRGVIHGDIRLWNFMMRPEGQLFLIDFEYAYSRSQEREILDLLRVHHGRTLKSAFDDWMDVLDSVADLWSRSSNPLLRARLARIPARISTILRGGRAFLARCCEGLRRRCLSFWWGLACSRKNLRP